MCVFLLSLPLSFFYFLLSILSSVLCHVCIIICFLYNHDPIMIRWFADPCSNVVSPQRTKSLKIMPSIRFQSASKRKQCSQAVQPQQLIHRHTTHIPTETNKHTHTYRPYTEENCGCRANKKKYANENRKPKIARKGPTSKSTSLDRKPNNKIIQTQTPTHTHTHAYSQLLLWKKI